MIREINNHGKTTNVGGDDTVKIFGDVDDNNSVDDFLDDIVGRKAPLKKKGSKVQVRSIGGKTKLIQSSGQ